MNLVSVGYNFLNNCNKLKKITFTQSQMIKFIINQSDDSDIDID
jgi:hypothetical protein